MKSVLMDAPFRPGRGVCGKLSEPLLTTYAAARITEDSLTVSYSTTILDGMRSFANAGRINTKYSCSIERLRHRQRNFLKDGH